MKTLNLAPKAVLILSFMSLLAACGGSSNRDPRPFPTSPVPTMPGSGDPGDPWTGGGGTGGSGGSGGLLPAATYSFSLTGKDGAADTWEADVPPTDTILKVR